MKDCQIIRVLNKKGDELLFNLLHNNTAYREYEDYIKVSQEFFEWVFLAPEEKQEKEDQIQREKDAV